MYLRSREEQPENEESKGFGRVEPAGARFISKTRTEKQSDRKHGIGYQRTD